MRLVILQPGYLPWLGMFDQMAWADTFVIYDDVAYDRDGWRNRNRIKTPQGIQWLTVPVLTKGKENPLVQDVLINNTVHWAKDHMKTIKQNYSKARYFNDLFGIFEKIYSIGWECLIGVDMAFIYAIKDYLGINAEILLSSDLDVPKSGKIQRLVDMCLKLGVTEFLEGSAGRNYLEGEGEQLFAQNGIKLTYQDYQHPVYHQLYGEFVPYLSVIDLLFNCGKESLDILTGKKVIV